MISSRFCPALDTRACHGMDHAICSSGAAPPPLENEGYAAMHLRITHSAPEFHEAAPAHDQRPERNSPVPELSANSRPCMKARRKHQT
jgi:hypothetical protein